jgi:hypothetical protein
MKVLLRVVPFLTLSTSALGSVGVTYDYTAILVEVLEPVSKVLLRCGLIGIALSGRRWSDRK